MINRIALKPQVWNLFFFKCYFFILLYVPMFKMTLRRFEKKKNDLKQLHLYHFFNLTTFLQPFQLSQIQDILSMTK